MNEINDLINLHRGYLSFSIPVNLIKCCRCLKSIIQFHNTDWFDLPAFCLLIKHCEYHFVCRPWTQFVFSSPVKILSLSALLLNNTSSVFATFYRMSNLGLLRKASKSFNIKKGPPQCGIYTLGQLSKFYVLFLLVSSSRWNENFVIQRSV